MAELRGPQLLGFAGQLCGPPLQTLLNPIRFPMKHSSVQFWDLEHSSPLIVRAHATFIFAYNKSPPGSQHSTTSVRCLFFARSHCL